MKKYLLSILIIWSFGVTGQEVLTWNDVVKLSLENNFGIKILHNQSEIAKNENHAGNAGYLPTVDVGASQNWTSNNVRLEFFSGQINEVDNAKSTNSNAFAELNWTFFDGFKMFATDKLLDQQEKYASTELRAEMEGLIYDLATIYAEGVKIEAEIKALEESAQLSQIRYDYIKTRLEAGAGSKTELIQAELDQNNDQAQIIRAENRLIQVKYNLIQTMGYESADAFSFEESFTINPPDGYEEDLISIDSLNQELLMARIKVSEAQYNKKISQSEFYPKMDVNASYNFNNSTSEAGVLFSNRSLGPSLTLQLRWNIFGSFQRIKNLQNSKLMLESAEIFEEQIKFTKNTELKRYYETLSQVQKIYNLDQDNLKKIEEQIAIAENSFKNGKINAYELREIQFSVQQIKLNQIESQLQLELAKANIAYLTGKFQNLLK